MAPIPRIPDALRRGPFTRAEALAAGMTSRQLEGSYLLRPFPRVYVVRDCVMTDLDWIIAAEKSMPNRAQLSHVSRLRMLGLDVAALRPFHFTIVGDLHLDVPDVFLHRTKILPALDDVGLTPAAAFIQYCDTARMIDAIKVGDWLLHRRHMTTVEVAELGRRDDWRPGAVKALRVLRHLDAAARSLKESETRALVTFAGMPTPEVNVDLIIAGRWLGCVDLLFRLWLLVLEYEGRQHAFDTAQFNSDIVRYAGYRGAGVGYMQITGEMLQQPRAVVLAVHGKLVERGFDGAPPVFGARWHSLFEPIAARHARAAVR